MARAIKASVNIDKLKVCLIQPEGLFERIYKKSRTILFSMGLH